MHEELRVSSWHSILPSFPQTLNPRSWDGGGGQLWKEEEKRFIQSVGEQGVDKAVGNVGRRSWVRSGHLASASQAAAPLLRLRGPDAFAGPQENHCSPSSGQASRQVPGTPAEF